MVASSTPLLVFSPTAPIFVGENTNKGAITKKRRSQATSFLLRFLYSLLGQLKFHSRLNFFRSQFVCLLQLRHRHVILFSYFK